MYKTLILFVLPLILISGCTTEGNVIKNVSKSGNDIICEKTTLDCGNGIVVSCKNEIIDSKCTDCEPNCEGMVMDLDNAVILENLDDIKSDKEIQKNIPINTESSSTGPVEEPVETEEIIEEPPQDPVQEPLPECVESWSCSDWSECIENIQTRNCIDDNLCGTEENKTEESQSCIVVIEATVNDVVLNEVMPDPSNESEWFELYNPTDFDIDLTGTWFDDFLGSDGSQPPQPIISGIIESKNVLVIELTKYKTSYFNNGKEEEVNFLDSDGNVIDSFSYSTTEKGLSWQKLNGEWIIGEPTKGF